MTKEFFERGKQIAKWADKQGEADMSCNNCNQGRNCNCDRSGDRAVVTISALILIALLAMGYGVFKLVNGTKGQDCAVEVQFKDSKATYIGTSI